MNMYIYSERIKVCTEMIHTNLRIMILMTSDERRKKESKSLSSVSFKTRFEENLTNHQIYYFLYFSVFKYFIAERIHYF